MYTRSYLITKQWFLSWVIKMVPQNRYKLDRFLSLCKSTLCDGWGIGKSNVFLEALYFMLNEINIDTCSICGYKTNNILRHICVRHRYRCKEMCICLYHLANRIVSLIIRRGGGRKPIYKCAVCLETFYKPQQCIKHMILHHFRNEINKCLGMVELSL